MTPDECLTLPLGIEYCVETSLLARNYTSNNNNNDKYLYSAFFKK